MRRQPTGDGFSPLAALRSLVEAGLKRIGTPRIKSKIWDKEFSSGKWDYLRSSNSSRAEAGGALVGILNELVSSGCILDLGCGFGQISLQVSPAYEKYTGVDVSSKAINWLNQHVSDDGIRERIELHVDTIENYIPRQLYDVILFNESIYYVNPREIGRELRRYCEYLTDTGHIVVTLHSKFKYDSVIKLIRRQFLETLYMTEDSNSRAIVVFRAK